MMSSPMPAGPKYTLSSFIGRKAVVPPTPKVFVLTVPTFLLVSMVTSEEVRPFLLVLVLLSLDGAPSFPESLSSLIIIVPVEVFWRASVTRFKMKEIFYTFSVIIVGQYKTIFSLHQYLFQCVYSHQSSNSAYCLLSVTQFLNQTITNKY